MMKLLNYVKNKICEAKQEFTWCNIQFAVKYSVKIVLLLYFIIIGICVGTGVLNNISHVAVIRIIRGGVFTFLVCVVLILSFDAFRKDIKIRLKMAAFVPSLWFCLYFYVFICYPKSLINDFGNYLIMAALMYFLSFCILSMISKCQLLGKCIWGFVYVLFSFMHIIPALFYAIYFAVYGQDFDEFALLNIIATNPEEIYNYILTFSVEQGLGIGIVLMALIGSVLFFSYRAARFSSFGVKSKNICIVGCIITFGFWVHYVQNVFPLDQWLHLQRQDGSMHAFVQLQNNIGINSEKIVLTDTNTILQTVPGSVIVVIGESANRDRMSAFNAAFPKDTTPWEREMKEMPGFYFFKNSYANFPNTVMAVTYALTNANQYNGKGLRDAVSILDIAKKAGYTTYWLSFQNKSTVSDAGVTVVANRADHVQWLQGKKDEEIISELKKISNNKKSFIVIHLNGSHFRYDKRVPEKFLRDHQLEGKTTEEHYDNTLLYTDDVLKQIYTYAKDSMKLQALVYFSDHGEDMKYTHTSSPFYFSMVRIPFWIYLSSEYRDSYPTIAQRLQLHQDDVFTNDLMFETISGILQAKSNYYEGQYDITNEAYDLDITRAKTMQGKVNISEDV